MSGLGPDNLLDALPVGIVAHRNGDLVYMNAEAKRRGLGDAQWLTEFRRSARDDRNGPSGADGIIEFEGSQGEDILVLLPRAVLAGLHPELAENLQLLGDFQEIFRNSFDGIFVADGDGRTLMVNAGCERNYDLSAADMVGRHVSEFEAAGFIRPVIATQVIAARERVTAVQRTHKGKTIMVTGIPLLDEGGAVRRVVINSRDTTELMQLQEELARVQDDLARMEGEVALLRQDSLKLDGVVLQSEAMKRVADVALRVAKVDATVLLTGESGVGKEVVARLIHKQSPRAEAPFIKINCGAIPRELLESELFGYEGGAFTGAQKKGKPGLVELAVGGALFLDEIGELPVEMQVKLLHLLQDRKVTRVGGTQAIPIDVRILAATNRDLSRMVAAKSFRADLFYRLSVVPIEIPPLRERRDDIVPLVTQALAALNAQYKTARRFTPSSLEHLIQCDWPGNVRELRNMVERLVVMAVDDTIGLDQLPQLGPGNTDLTNEGDLDLSVTAYERRLIEAALKRFGSTRAAARHLGISQSSVVRKLKRSNWILSRSG